MMRLPDFMIIGSMKSATSTLHTQLSLQPGVRAVQWYAGEKAQAD